MAMQLPGWHADFAASPLFLGLEALAARFARCDDWPGLERLNQLAEAQAVRNAAALPVRFAPQEARCGQRDYEDGIHATGRVPTRADNWHDFFNALIWLAYPRTKAALNACQHAGLQDLAGGRRGPVSDAATLFDESGLVLVAPEPHLADLLQAKCWRAAFWDQRALWLRARVYVIGHSLLEKAMAPTPGITGKCLFIRDARAERLTAAELDKRIALHWREGRIRRPADLFPLPVFGIPGYAAGNADPAFYDDLRVFRPPPPVTCTSP